MGLLWAFADTWLRRSWYTIGKRIILLLEVTFRREEERGPFATGVAVRLPERARASKVSPIDV